MRLLLVGAFAYPHPQGSQVYFQEQAIALRAAGASVDLLTYANGTRPDPSDRDQWRALDGFDHYTSSAWTSPASARSGPNWRKPLADLGLIMTLRDAIASKMPPSTRYDAILTHNAEACLAAVLTQTLRHELPIPVVYCVHTLLGNELSAYSKHLKKKDFQAVSESREARPDGIRRMLKRAVDRTGGAVDRLLARRVDGWIALTHSSARVMRRSSNAPGVLIPPAIPDPRHRAEALDPTASAIRHGLVDNDFYLYSGNLDGYQELELIAAAARLRGGDGDGDGARIVLASHDPAVLESRLVREAGLEARLVASEAEMLSLLAAARASLVTRRAAGGFPIKLVNSLAVGTAPISFLEREWGLTDGENARVARGESPAAALAQAIQSLDRSPEEAAQLGAGARGLYEAKHLPKAAAERTLQLIERIHHARA